MEVSTQNAGKTASCVKLMIRIMHEAHYAEVFPPFLVWIPPSTQKNITIPYHFISTLLNANFDFDVNVANSVAKCALPGKVMQGSPCQAVHTLTNENGCYIIKLYISQLTTVKQSITLPNLPMTFTFDLENQ